MGQPSAADLALAPHIKAAFVAQGGREMEPDKVASFIKSNVASYNSVPEGKIEEGITRVMNHWKRKHAGGGKPAPAPKAAAASAGAAGGKGDSSDEFEEQQRRGDGPKLMEVPETNLMNQQLRASMAAAQTHQGGASGGAMGATKAAAMEIAAASCAAKKRKAHESSLSQSPTATRRRRKREKNKLRSGDGHAKNNQDDGRPGDDDGSGPPSKFTAADRPTARLRDMGGVEPCLQAIRELIEWPLAHPEVYGHLGVDAPRGVLLHGPPGCGKTLLANAIAGELGVPFFSKPHRNPHHSFIPREISDGLPVSTELAATEVIAGTSGESERLIRSIFDQAKAAAPSLLFIDEVDAITPKREHAQREMEKRIVAQLLTSMDELKAERAPNSKSEDPDASDAEDGSKAAADGAGAEENEAEDFPKNVIVIGATNRPDAIDPALRRAGRFDREISLGIPDEGARARILETLARGLRVNEGVSWAGLARSTPGFVGADLKALTREAATIAIKRIFGDLGKQPAPPALAAIEAPPPGISMPPGINAAAPAAAATTAGGDGEETPKEEPGADSKDGSAAAAAAAAAPTLSGVGEDMLSPAQLSPLSINAADFTAALEFVQPSSQREGFATIPDVSFDDVGALTDVRHELEMAIVQPVLQPEKFAAFGLTPNAGVLLYGPPGCGKTLLAKAIAHHAKVNFISIKGPELLNKYVLDAICCVYTCRRLIDLSLIAGTSASQSVP